MPAPCRGEVWQINLNPTKGHEQAGIRPALVVSDDDLNHGPGGMIVVVPLTSKRRRIPLHVRVQPPEGGVKLESWAKCEQVRSLSTDRLLKRWGQVHPATMASVEDRLRVVLGI